jgi:hypothetical protein
MLGPDQFPEVNDFQNRQFLLRLDKVIPSDPTLLDDAVKEITAALDCTACWDDADIMSIPVKWSTDSGGSGPASESLTQVKNMMIDVDHFSQEKSIGMAGSASFRFLLLRFARDRVEPLSSGELVQSYGDVGRRSGEMVHRNELPSPRRSAAPTAMRPQTSRGAA